MKLYRILFDYMLHPGLIVKKLFLLVNLQTFVKSYVFVPGKPFQPSLMFVGKAVGYPTEEPFMCSDLGVGSWPFPVTLD